MSEAMETKSVELEQSGEAVAVETEQLEVKAADVEIEAKADDLDVVRKAVDTVTAEANSVKAQNAELQQKSENLEGELKAKAAELEQKAAALEELEAKMAAPKIHVKKDVNNMESKVQFKTFLSEGIEGLRSKAADLQIGVDAQGGYALPEELRREIIEIEHEISPLRQVVSVASAATTDVKQLVSIGDAASGWVGETTTRGDTNSPELAQRSATFGEVYAKPLVYQHMLEDAFFGVESWLTKEVARQFAEAEGAAFLNGNGSNKPVGILNGLTLSSSSAANDTTGAYQVINSGVDGVLGATDVDVVDFLRSVVIATKTGYLSNAKWMMNRATHDLLVNLKNGNGEYFLQRNLTEAAASKLFGFDIIINEDMADIPATTGDACPILFGDFARAYQIIDRVGVSMTRDPYTQPGAVKFYTRKRVGSMVLDASALKVVAVSKA